MALFFQAVFLLIGTIVGAGVFALPYVFSKSGFLPSFFGLLFLGIILTILNLFYTQVILKTTGDHQFPGYVKKHLGANWGKIALLSMLISANGALIAYVILGGGFLALAFGQISYSWHSFWFYFLSVIIFWRGFKNLVKWEAWLTIFLIGLMLIIPLKLIPFFRAENLVLIRAKPLFFWGATLFSLVGFSIIPELEEILRHKHKLLMPAVIVGSIVPVIIYLFFAFSVWGVSGWATTVDSLSGLIAFSPNLARSGAVVGLLALITSFLSLASVVKEIYFRDLKIDEDWSKLIAVLLPLIGVFLSTKSFISIISFTGAVGLAISGIMISLMFAKVIRKARWLSWLINLVLILGIFAEFFGSGL